LFRVLKLDQHQPVLSEGPDAVRPPPPGETCWIDLENFSEIELTKLRERFDFHPLTIEDCLQPAQRAKVDDHGGYLFIVTHAVGLLENGAQSLQAEQLGAFLGTNYVVTVHRHPIAALGEVWQRYASGAAAALPGADFIFYLVIDAMVDEIFPIVDQLSDQIEDTEAEILKNLRPRDLPKLLRLKRTLISLRRLLASERDVLALLLRRGDARVSDRTAPYLRDVYDHLVRAYEEVDLERDLIGNAMDAYHSVVAKRSNDIMKRLTILTGFFGQNFTAMPFDSKTLLYFELAACVALPPAMYFWFWWSGWL
jgi:magnesium transporter